METRSINIVSVIISNHSRQCGDSLVKLRQLRGSQELKTKTMWRKIRRNTIFQFALCVPYVLCLLSQRLGNNVELISFLHRTGKQSKPSFCSIRQRERQKPCNFCSPNVNTMKAKGYRSDVHRCCFEPRLALVQENQVIMVIKKHSF